MRIRNRSLSTPDISLRDKLRWAYNLVFRPYSCHIWEFQNLRIPSSKRIVSALIFVVTIADLISLTLIELFAGLFADPVALILKLCLGAWFAGTIGISLGFGLSSEFPLKNTKTPRLYLSLLSILLILLSCVLLPEKDLQFFQGLLLVVGSNLFGVFLGLLNYQGFLEKNPFLLSLPTDIKEVFQTISKRAEEIDFDVLFDTSRVGAAKKKPKAKDETSEAKNTTSWIDDALSNTRSKPRHYRSDVRERKRTKFIRYEQNIPAPNPGNSAPNERSSSGFDREQLLQIVAVLAVVFWILAAVFFWVGSWIVTFLLFFFLVFIEFLEKFGPSIARFCLSYIRSYPYIFGSAFTFLIGLITLPLLTSDSAYIPAVSALFLVLAFILLAVTLPPTWIFEAFALAFGYLRLSIKNLRAQRTTSAGITSPGYFFEYIGSIGFPFLENYLNLGVSVLPFRNTFDKLLYVTSNPSCTLATIQPVLQLMAVNPAKRLFTFYSFLPHELRGVVKACRQIEQVSGRRDFLSEFLQTEVMDEPVLVIDKIVLLMKLDKFVDEQSFHALNQAVLMVVAKKQVMELTNREQKIITKNLPFILRVGAQRPDLEIFSSAVHLSVFYDYENALEQLSAALADEKLKQHGISAFGAWIDSPLLASNTNASVTLLGRFDYLVEKFRSLKEYDLADQYFLKIVKTLTPLYPETILDKILSYSRVDRWRRLCVEAFDGWLTYLDDNYSDILLNTIYTSGQKYLEAISALDEASPGSLFVRRLIDLRKLKNNDLVLEDIILYAERVPDRAVLLIEPLSSWIVSLSNESAQSLFRSFTENTDGRRVLRAIQIVEKDEENSTCLRIFVQKALSISPVHTFFAIVYLAREQVFKHSSAVLLLDWTESAHSSIFERVLTILVSKPDLFTLLNEIDEAISSELASSSHKSDRYPWGPRLILSRLLFSIAVEKGWKHSLEFVQILITKYGFTRQTRDFIKSIFEQMQSESINLLRYLLSRKSTFAPLFKEIDSNQPPIPHHSPASIWDIYTSLSLALSSNTDANKVSQLVKEGISILLGQPDSVPKQETIKFLTLCETLIVDTSTQINDFDKINSILSAWPEVPEVLSACKQLIASAQKIPINRKIDWESALASLSYQLSQIENKYTWPESGLFIFAVRRVIETWSHRYDQLKLVAEFKVDARSNFRHSDDLTMIDVTLIIRNIGLHSARNILISIDGNEYIDIRRYDQSQIAEVESEKTIEKQVFVVALKSGFKIIDVILKWQDGTGFLQTQKYPVEVTRPFRKVVNPYVPGSAVDNPDVFVGRENEIKRLMDGVADIRQKRNFLIIGPSRMGKSSLLRQLIRRANDAYLPISIDFQGTFFEKSDLANLFWYIADSIHVRMKEYFPSVPQPQMTLIRQSPALELKKYVNDVLVPVVRNRCPIVIIIDEFNWLTKNVTENRFPPDIFFFLRHLLEDQKWPRMILAGNINPAEVIFPEAREIIKSCDLIQLRELSFEQTSELIRSPLKRLIEVDDGAVQRIYYNTKGHPYLIQKICSAVINLINDKKHSYMTAEDVEEVIQQILSTEEEVFLNIVGRGYLTENARLLLSKASKQIDIGQSFNALQLKEIMEDTFELSLIRVLMKELERRLLINHLKDDSTVYQIKMPLLHLWLRDFALE